MKRRSSNPPGGRFVGDQGERCDVGRCPEVGEWAFSIKPLRIGRSVTSCKAFVGCGQHWRVARDAATAWNLRGGP